MPAPDVTKPIKELVVVVEITVFSTAVPALMMTEGGDTLLTEDDLELVTE